MRHHQSVHLAARSVGSRAVRRLLPAALVTVAAVAICQPADAVAQEAAVLAASASTAPIIQYAPNESGGRIRISSPAPDSGAIESIRVHLLENAAAIRRGDFRNVRVIRSEHPAVQVLADRRAAVRCTFRLTPRGGELVLLSSDDAVVAAIHQLLRSAPPRMASL